MKDIAELLSSSDNPYLNDDMTMLEVDPETGYAAMADNYDNSNNVIVRTEQPTVHDILATIPPGTALDAACGTGRHAEYLCSLGHDVIAVDQSEPMLMVARRKVPQADIRLGSLHALPVQDASVDVAVCALALTHLQDPGPAIAELSRTLKPGGQLVISDVHPFFAALGLHGMVRGEQGPISFVRNYFHPHSRYMDIFSRTGLRLTACAEPKWDKQVFDETQRLMQLYAEGSWEAVRDMPLILTWHLTRED